ncbi:MAG: hypothetical protein GX083_03660 [Clostridiales bacterium]|nr:hypothetical protein [Clostridiales bacterium]
MATNKTEERSKIVRWFEDHFKEAAKETTKTIRLDDGGIEYSFAVLNNSSFDFSQFSFKVKILDKVGKKEIGTSKINAGKWSAGQNKNFKTKLSVPSGVTSLSFVMFSDSIEYELQEDKEKPTLAEAIEGFGKSLNESGINGKVLGELFSKGGMPEGTTTTRTSTVTIGDTTTTTQTVTHSKTKQSSKSSAARSSSASGKSSSGAPAGYYAKKKEAKKINKLRLGKSGGFVACMIFGILILIAASSPDNTKSETIQYLVAGGGLVALGGIIKMMALGKSKRIRTYEVKVNKNGNTSLHKLSIEMSRPVAKVADDLQKMIMQGFFPDSYVDSSNGLLVMTRNGEPIEPIEKSVEESKKARMMAARKEGMLPESIGDLITMTEDVDIKKKLKELKALTDRIDARVQERADLAEQVKDFREKFFPEVVRLADDYNGKIAGIGTEIKKETTDGEIDANPNFLAEQSKKIKDQLISLMDSVLEASENLLERLHEDDIMDISTDIQMLQTTLASKGLLDSDFDIK